MITRLRLRDPTLDFWVDVCARPLDGVWVAVAELGGSKEMGAGRTPQQAIREALESLGDDAAERLSQWA